MSSNLFLAIQKGDIAGVKKQLAKPVAMQLKNKQGFTPLMIAAGYGQAEIVTLLTRRGADVNVLDSTMGVSALHLACQNGDVDTIQALLSAGAFVNLQAVCSGMTPLMNAIWHRNAEAVALLLQQPNLNLKLATHYGITAKQLIASQVETSAGRQLTPKEIKATRKIQAAIEGYEQSIIDVPLVAALATQGSDFEQHQQYLNKYFQQHPDMNLAYPISSSGYDLHTALHVAAGDGLIKICEILLKAGADISVKEAYLHATPIHKAAYGGHAHVLRLLATHHGFSEVIDNQSEFNGYTALHYAVWQGHLEATRVLLDCGADTALVGYDGYTALDLAKMYDFYDIEELLEPVEVFS